MPNTLKRCLLKVWMLTVISWMALYVSLGNVFVSKQHLSQRDVPSAGPPSDVPVVTVHLLSSSISTKTANTTTWPATNPASIKDLVASYCKAHPKDSDLHNMHNQNLGGLFFADKKRNLLFALNFKVAASTLIRSVPNSSGLVPPNEVEGLEDVDLRTPAKLRKYGLSHINMKRKNSLKSTEKYFKFMFVRNPYKRLLSGFRDKFRIHSAAQLPDEWFTSTVNQVVTKYRTEGEELLAPKLNETAITFEEFLKLVIDEHKKLRTMNEHWKPLYLQSMPCIVNYTFIGKFETFTQDFQYLMSKIAVTQVPEVKMHSSPGASTGHVFKKYWSQIPPNIVQQIARIFTRDFEMFNYNKDLNYYL